MAELTTCILHLYFRVVIHVEVTPPVYSQPHTAYSQPNPVYSQPKTCILTTLLMCVITTMHYILAACIFLTSTRFLF